MIDLDAESKIRALLEAVIANNATDLHITEGKPPSLRIDGKLLPIKGMNPLSGKESGELARGIMDPALERRLDEEREVDFSYTYQDKARFRVNVYHQKGFLAAAMRLIPTKIRTVEELNLPEVLQTFTNKSQGFFLSVGPSGHGKSTALAAMLNEVNKTRYSHVITIEDPIEYLFVPDKCLIEQREVFRDTNSFHKALRSALRQDPDVIYVGEMRDAETIAAAMTAAETGHLVFATLHTNDAAQTIDRIVDTFPPYQQNQARYQLANSLIGILSRRLLPKIGGGIINAVELLIVNSAIKNLIRENKIYQIPSVIETSGEEGMVSLNRSLANLVREKVVEDADAASFSPNVNEFRIMVENNNF